MEYGRLLKFTLAQSPMENWGDRNLTMCRYQAFRDDTGKYTMVHWQVLALKLAFVICFEHVVFGICRGIDLLVPDIPESLDIKIKRERYLAKQALADAEQLLQQQLTGTDHDSDKLDSDQEASTGSPLLRKR